MVDTGVIVEGTMEARVDITAPLINEVSDRPSTTTVSDRDSNGMRGESCPMSALESRADWTCTDLCIFMRICMCI